METAERIRTMLGDLINLRIELRLTQELSGKDNTTSERLLSVLTHLELAFDHLLEIHGQVTLAEHLRSEIVDLGVR